MANTMISLNLTGCSTCLDLHDRIKHTFDFPDCYGRNWSAFYDFMCTEVPSSHIVVTGAYSVPVAIQDEVSRMIAELEDVKSARLKLNDMLTFEIIS